VPVRSSGKRARNALGSGKLENDPDVSSGEGSSRKEPDMSSGAERSEKEPDVTLERKSSRETQGASERGALRGSWG